MTTTAMESGSCSGGAGCGHCVEKLWNDAVRDQQNQRFSRLQLQVCLEAGKAIRSAVLERWQQLPEAIRKKVDVPSSHVFAAVLGVCRTGATLKDNAMLVLELSVKEIARLIGYGRSQVAAAFRWLVDGPIEIAGQVVAEGLGLVTRTARKGIIRQCKRLRGVWRTSLLEITEAGRGLLGLGNGDDKAQATATTRSSEATREARYGKRSPSATPQKGKRTRWLSKKSNAVIARLKGKTGNQAPSPPEPEPTPLGPPETWSESQRIFMEMAQTILAKKREREASELT